MDQFKAFIHLQVEQIWKQPRELLHQHSVGKFTFRGWGLFRRQSILEVYAV
jgi:hypothetical protein